MEAGEKYKIESRIYLSDEGLSVSFNIDADKGSYDNRLDNIKLDTELDKLAWDKSDEIGNDKEKRMAFHKAKGAFLESRKEQFSEIVEAYMSLMSSKLILLEQEYKKFIEDYK